jgi:hypothetical protein
MRSSVESAMPAVSTDALVSVDLKIWFGRHEQTGHPRVGYLGVLKFNTALHAFKDPFGHRSPQKGDSQSAGSTMNVRHSTRLAR